MSSKTRKEIKKEDAKENIVPVEQMFIAKDTLGGNS